MAFNEIELRRIDKHVGGLCRGMTRPELRHELEFVYKVSGHSVSIYEVRPAWRDPARKIKMGVARFRYIRARDEWRLYWMRKDLKWHRYDTGKAAARELKDLVRIVAEDPCGAFFG